MIRTRKNLEDEFDCTDCGTRFKIWDWRLEYGEVTCPFCNSTDVPQGGPNDSEDLVQYPLF